MKASSIAVMRHRPSSRGLCFFAGVALLALMATSAQAAKPRLSVGLGSMLDVRVGLEHPWGSRMSVKADGGISIMGMVTCDFLVVFHMMPRESDLQFDFYGGIPNAGAPLSFAGCMVSLGGGFRIGYPIWENVYLDLRLGVGFPFFFEPDTRVIRDMKAWPDICIGIRIPL
jgi:hypothetical protein